MVFLANAAENSPTDVKIIAQKLGIPHGYLARIFQRLARTHLVYSRRGPQGGYVLSREPSKISLLSIIEAIDGPILTGHCELGPNDHCQLFQQCSIRTRLDSLKESTRELYQNITLDMFDHQFANI